MFIDGRQDRSNPITTIVEVNLSGETLEGRLYISSIFACIETFYWLIQLIINTHMCSF